MKNWAVICRIDDDDTITFVVPAQSWRDALAWVANLLVEAHFEPEKAVGFTVQEQPLTARR